MVAADGRVVKQQKRKNESGATVTGDAEKSGTYAKWARTTKKRIQKVGELENASQTHVLGKWARQMQAAQQGKTVEFGGDDADDDTDTRSIAAQRKPVVPYHGQIDAKHLTHKQKRMMQKRDKKDRVVKGPAKKE